MVFCRTSKVLQVVFSELVSSAYLYQQLLRGEALYVHMILSRIASGLRSGGCHTHAMGAQLTNLKLLPALLQQCRYDVDIVYHQQLYQSLLRTHASSPTSEYDLIASEVGMVRFDRYGTTWCCDHPRMHPATTATPKRVL